MIVNGKEYKIDDLVKNLNINENSLEKYGSIFLTKREVSILSSYKIDYKSVSSYNDLRRLIEEFLDDEDNSELEWVLDEISNRNYYENIRK